MKVARLCLALVVAAELAGCAPGENEAATAGEMVKGGSDENGEYVP
jgi:hypothetical protein